MRRAAIAPTGPQVVGDELAPAVIAESLTKSISAYTELMNFGHFCGCATRAAGPSAWPLLVAPPGMIAPVGSDDFSAYSDEELAAMKLALEVRLKRFHTTFANGCLPTKEEAKVATNTFDKHKRVCEVLKLRIEQRVTERFHTLAVSQIQAGARQSAHTRAGDQAAVRLQMAARQKLARRAVRTRLWASTYGVFGDVQDAAVVLQAAARRVAAKRVREDRFWQHAYRLLNEDAATRMQSGFRAKRDRRIAVAHLQQSQRDKETDRMSSAALVVQRATREKARIARAKKRLSRVYAVQTMLDHAISGPVVCSAPPQWSARPATRPATKPTPPSHSLSNGDSAVWRPPLRWKTPKRGTRDGKGGRTPHGQDGRPRRQSQSSSRGVSPAVARSPPRKGSPSSRNPPRNKDLVAATRKTSPASRRPPPATPVVPMDIFLELRGSGASQPKSPVATGGPV